MRSEAPVPVLPPAKTELVETRIGMVSLLHRILISNAAKPQRGNSLEDLARSIAGNAGRLVTLDHARKIAEAELKLAQVRRLKLAIISRIGALGQPEMNSSHQPGNFLSGAPPDPSIPDQTEAPTPQTEPAHDADAISRTLAELLRLNRYERRAAARRDHALLKSSGIR